jgi:hypothetical protein
MKPSQKIALIDRIGRELQARYSYREIGTYLTEFGVPTPNEISVNSKWIYVKEALSGVGIDVIEKIADDLELSIPSMARLEPKNWKSTSYFRLFISHISEDKLKATRLRDCLTPLGISSFVAHQDIHPTLEWQQRSNERSFLWMHFLPFIRSAFQQVAGLSRRSGSP